MKGSLDYRAAQSDAGKASARIRAARKAAKTRTMEERALLAWQTQGASLIGASQSERRAVELAMEDAVPF